MNSHGGQGEVYSSGNWLGLCQLLLPLRFSQPEAPAKKTPSTPAPARKSFKETEEDSFLLTSRRNFNSLQSQPKFSPKSQPGPVILILLQLETESWPLKEWLFPCHLANYLYAHEGFKIIKMTLTSPLLCLEYSFALTILVKSAPLFLEESPYTSTSSGLGFTELVIASRSEYAQIYAFFTSKII